MVLTLQAAKETTRLCLSKIVIIVHLAFILETFVSFLRARAFFFKIEAFILESSFLF